MQEGSPLPTLSFFAPSVPKPPASTLLPTVEPIAPASPLPQYLLRKPFNLHGRRSQRPQSIHRSAVRPSRWTRPDQVRG